MSDKNKTDNLSDEDVENIFKEHSHEVSDSTHREKQTEKIIQRATNQTSAKTIAEFTFVSFWTGVLEFIALFCTFLQQKSVEKKDKPSSKDTGEK